MATKDEVSVNQIVEALKPILAKAVRKTGDELLDLRQDPNEQLRPLDITTRNPQHEADLKGGTTLVQAIHDQLAETCGYDAGFLTEELIKRGVGQVYKSALTRNAYEKIISFAEFCENRQAKDIRCLNDPLDGTECYDIREPNWGTVSTAVIGQEKFPRITALYEPEPGLITVACLKGSPNKLYGEAYTRNLHSRKKDDIDLVAEAKKRATKELSRTVLAYHFPRSDDLARKQFLDPFDEIYRKCRIMFQENCGSVTMRKIMTGEPFDGFICPSVPIHDALYGIPMIMSIGGAISTFSGKAIETTSGMRISVVAAANPEIHAQLVEILMKHYKYPSAA